MAAADRAVGLVGGRICDATAARNGGPVAPDDRIEPSTDSRSSRFGAGRGRARY